MKPASKTLLYDVVETDLWRDADGGWSANGCIVNRYGVEVAEDSTDLAIARAIKQAAGWAGRGRKDGWCGADFCWRDGTMGLYSDLVG